MSSGESVNPDRVCAYLLCETYAQTGYGSFPEKTPTFLRFLQDACGWERKISIMEVCLES